jgi:hypothetical protein
MVRWRRDAVDGDGEEAFWDKSWEMPDVELVK